MKIVGLFRVSTEKQLNRGASLAAQERRFDELAAANNWRVVARLRGSESATKAAAERQIFQDALRAIRDHDADAIYVHEQSRLTRGDELEAALLIRELRERGCKVVVCGNVRDLDSIDDRFVFRIQSVVDRAEAERLVERCNRGRRERAKQGRWYVGRAPFGYENPPPGDPRRGTLQIVPSEAAIIREVFRRYLRGESMRRIALATGRPNSTVKQMLRNPAYKGALAPFRWTRPGSLPIVEGAHEAIVSVADWDAAQDRIELRANYGGGTPALLTGLLHVNGEPAGAESTHQGRFYRVERGPWLSRESLERQVWDGFTRMIETPQWIEELRRAAEAGDDGSGGRDAEALAAEYRNSITRLERRLSGFQTMLADGDMSKADYRRRSDETNRQLAEARRALAELDAAPDLGDTLDAVAESMAAIISGDIDDCHRRRLLESAVTRIDATAFDRRRAHFERDERGRIAGTDGRRWQVEHVRFSCADMGRSAVCSANVANTVSCVVVADFRPVLRFETLPPRPLAVADGRVA